jgi:hypothetical protein
MPDPVPPADVDTIIKQLDAVAPTLLNQRQQQELHAMLRRRHKVFARNP